MQVRTKRLNKVWKEPQTLQLEEELMDAAVQMLSGAAAAYIVIPSPVIYS